MTAPRCDCGCGQVAAIGHASPRHAAIALEKKVLRAFDEGSDLLAEISGFLQGMQRRESGALGEMVADMKIRLDEFRAARRMERPL